MSYTPVNWENAPSTNTPLTAENLNRMDSGIAELDAELTKTTARVDKVEANKLDNTASAVKWFNLEDRAVNINKLGDKSVSLVKLADETFNLINSKMSAEEAENKSNKINSFDTTFFDTTNTKYPTINAVVEYLVNYFYSADETDEQFLGIRTQLEEIVETVNGKLSSANGAVKTNNIADKSITIGKLAQAVLDLIDSKISNSNGAVKWFNLEDRAVNINKLGDKSVSLVKLADETRDLIDDKYDASNIETGSGDFGIYSSATPGKSGTFTYQKVGNVATVSCVLVMSAGSGAHFTGLPFRTLKPSIVMTRINSTNRRCSVMANGTWISVISDGTTFADDDTIQITISYFIA